MANFTTCGFSLPWTITTATQIKLTLAGPVEVTATAVAGTYYNDMDLTVSGSTENLLGHLLHQLQTQETDDGTDGTWTITEEAGDYRGRYVLSRAKGDPGDSVTQLEILGGEVTLATLGSTADPAPPAVAILDPAVFTFAHRGAGHWILGPRGLLASTEERGRSIQTSTSSPDGTTVRDVYGETVRKQIDLLTVNGAEVFKAYSGDADFAAVAGCATGDDNAAFDELRRLWALVDDGVYARFTPDVTAPATYTQLQPGNGDEWLSTLDNAVEMVSEGPLYFDISIGAFVI